MLNYYSKTASLLTLVIASLFVDFCAANLLTGIPFHTMNKLNFYHT